MNASIARDGNELYIGYRVAQFDWQVGEFWITEMCDQAFGVQLSAADVQQLITYLSDQLDRLEAT